MKKHQAEKIDTTASELIEVLIAAQDAEGDSVSLADLLWGAARSDSLQKLRALLTLPEVCAVEVTVSDTTLDVRLRDGRRISVPLEYFPRLVSGAPSLRDNWRLVSGGIAIHWEELDEDVLINNLLTTRSFLR